MTKEKHSPKQLSLFTTNSLNSFSKNELDNEYFNSFTWAVPNAFKDPLSQCRFEEGDLLYNTTKAYLSPWAKALKHLKSCIQITFPPRAIRTDTNVESDTIFEGNWNGLVKLDFFIYENEKIKETIHIKTTQGNLYTFLWKGTTEVIENKENLQLPITAKTLKWLLRKLSTHQSTFILKNKYPSSIKIKKSEEQHLEKLSQDQQSIRNYLESILTNFLNLQKEHNAHEVFIIPHDKSNSLLNSKYNSFKKQIEKNRINHKVIYCRPINILNLKNKELLPTLQLACFLSFEKNDNYLLKTAKKLFYRPAKDRIKDEDKFRIESHGLHIASKTYNLNTEAFPPQVPEIV